MSPAPRRTVVLGTAAASLLLLLAAPTPAESLRTLRGADAGASADVTAPLVALLALVAWLLAAWLLLTVAVTAAGHLPGLAGRAAATVSRRMAPAAVRRTVEVALGLTVAVGVLGASPAAAAPGPGAAGPAAPPAASLDWSAPAPAPGLDWSAPASQQDPATAQDLDWSATAASTPAPDTAPETVVVQPGDSLWELAEQDLAARGEPTTDAAVAKAWPTWWAANRDAVGEDPDVIQPGTPLTPPPADGSAPAGPASS